MEEASAPHLSGEQFELLSSRLAGEQDQHEQGQSEQGQNEYAQGELDRAAAHLESCELCRAKARAYEAATMKLNRLNPVTRPNQDDCPRADEWPLVAAGATSPESAKEYLMHASQCDHCGPLVRTTRAFDDEFSPEDELVITRLQTRPLEQRRLAETLRAKSQAGSSPLKLAPSRWISFKKWPVLAYGLATTVLAMAVGLAVFFNARTESPDMLLAEAYSQQRTLEPRFIGAKYGPVRILRGEHGQSSLNKPQALLDAESLIHRHLLKDPNSTLWLDAKGRVDLLEGNYDAALQTFEKALDAEPDSPRWLTDAASAYFERGQLAGRPDDYGQAIELLGRALARSPDDPVALYNRALVNEKMFLYHQALEDWDHYLRIDPAGDWADEAKRHRDAVRQKLQQQKQSSEAPLLTPAGFLHEAQIRGPEFWDAVDHREEDYLDQAIRVWLPMAFEGENNEPQRSALAALRALGEILDKKHGDQWLLDIASAPRFREQKFAVLMLASAVKANTSGDYLSAMDLSARSERLFTVNHNMAGSLRARFETTYALQRSNQENIRCVTEADVALNRLQGHRYSWIETQLYLERFMCVGQLAHLNEASQDLGKAFVASEKSNYGTLYLRAIGMAASLHRGDGDAVLFDHQGLTRYWGGSYPPARAFQFYSDIAFVAEDAGRWSLALIAAREAVHAIAPANQPLTEGLARYQLARYALMIGDRSLADSESSQARILLASLPQNDVTRSYAVNQEVRLAKLETERGRVDQSWLHLEHAQILLPKANNYFTALRFYNALSELQLRKGNRQAAENALLSAVGMSELGLTSLRDEHDKADWARETGEAYRRLVLLRWESHDLEGAWKIWEWYLGAAIRGSAIRRVQPAVHTIQMNSMAYSNPDVVPALPSMEEVSRASSALADETVVSYLQLPEGLAIWVFDDRGLTAKWATAPSHEVERLARRFREECAHPDSDLAMLRKDAQALYELLIAPISDRLSPRRTLVIEPAGLLAEIPITALVDPAGHYLSETYAVIFSPGLLYRQHLRNPQSFSRHLRSLIVGPPPLVGSLAANLKPLEDAEHEAVEIAAQFDSAALLTGSQATVEKVERALGRAIIFHFAGHAIEVGGNPVLLLAGAPPSLETAVFDAEKIQAGDLNRLQLTVLSACSTGRNSRSSVSGLETLVRPFLRAGVPNVVAARWNVDSKATAEFMQSFYRALLMGQTASLSLQTARAELRHAPATAHPYYWAAFDAFGR